MNTKQKINEAIAKGDLLAVLEGVEELARQGQRSIVAKTAVTGSVTLKEIEDVAQDARRWAAKGICQHD